MFLSHTAGGLGQGWGQGHQSHFFACLVLANLVPRACDPWEGNEGSGIIRYRKPGIMAKIELRIHFNGQSDSSLKRIIPEPSFPSQGSQARGTRLRASLTCVVFVERNIAFLGLVVMPKESNQPKSDSRALRRQDPYNTSPPEEEIRNEVRAIRVAKTQGRVLRNLPVVPRLAVAHVRHLNRHNGRESC